MIVRGVTLYELSHLRFMCAAGACAGVLMLQGEERLFNQRMKE